MLIILFWKDIIAPANGTVEKVVNGVQEQQYWKYEGITVLGNYIVIKHAEKWV